jgi:hypothetical protein
MSELPSPKTSFLAKVPSSVFACAYLLLIPFFAVVYTTFAEEFYHPTAQYEQYVRDEQEHLLRSLRKSMISNYREVNGKKTPGSILDWDYVQLYDLRYEHGYFSFALLTDPQERQSRIPPTAARLRFALFWPRTAKGGQDQTDRMYGLSGDGAAPYTFLSELFPLNPRFSDEIQDKMLGFVVISRSLERDLLAWSDATLGFPAKSSTIKTFWRMLYFSAITITTLGFGDIIPITTRARLWVGAEAVLGILFIGLFLNSLAIKAQRPRTS